MWLSAPILEAADVRHAFSTRQGGVSEGPFRSANLGRSVGDDPEAVRENQRRFAEALGVAPERLAEVSQVHGTRVLRVGSDLAGLRDEEADAVWTDAPEVAVAVRTADCAPVLLRAWDPEGRTTAVAAVHAGWRGAVQGIVQQTLEALAAAGHAPERMAAAVGPCIGPGAFEVGEEVVTAFRAVLGDALRTHTGPRGRPHLDLPGAVSTLLVRAGLAPERVSDLGACTASDPERFFSHRRDAGRTGRHLSAIVMRR